MAISDEPFVRTGLRVLQVGPLYNNHVRRWAVNAVAAGWAVCAAGHIRPGRRPVDLEGIAEQVEVMPESLLELGTAHRVAWLRGVFRRLQPDLVHAHWLPSWAYFASLASHRPLAVTAWGSDVYRATGAERRRADLALNSADRVLASSRHMRGEMLARGVQAERIQLIDLGVDLHRFRPASAGERVRLRQELGLPGGPLVLSFRAGTELYNLDVVLDAFRILRGRLPGATLVLVHGDAPLAQRVRASVRELRGGGGVRVVGHATHADMSKYLRAATVGVSIPSSDGSPSSVWEALACGLPVVLSDLPQLDERVGASAAVRLVEPRPATVAAALHDVVARPRRHRRMAQAARAWAVANVDERDQVARLAQVYAAMEGGVASRPAPSPARAPDRPPAPGRATAAAAPPRPS
jgi:glycosyltransferase involved in cell wall biosynthesis